MRGHHHIRVTPARRLELLDKSIAVDYEMLHHLESCLVCNDEDGTCPAADEIYARVKAASGELKRIGFETPDFTQ